MVLRFTLLVGKPPFETDTLKDTYTRIKNNKYYIPSHVGPLARTLIQRLLQADPARRPNIHQIISDDFMTIGKNIFSFKFILPPKNFNSKCFRIYLKL